MGKLHLKYFFFCRLPKNLLEKMPSATNSPLIGRKSIPTIPITSGSPNNTDCDVAGTSTESTEQLVSQKNRLPLSVASMVRRFERDTSSKSRAGSSSSVPRSSNRGQTSGTNSDVTARYQQVTTPLSSRTSSLSSSQGFLNTLPGEKDYDENRDENKNESGREPKDSPKKSQVLSSKNEVNSGTNLSVKDKKNTFSSKKDSNIIEAVIKDGRDNTKSAVASKKDATNLEECISDSKNEEDDTSGSMKKTPITMTSVVRAATAPKDHQSSKEHKAALAAKRRATAPTTNTAAAVKASRGNINSNNSVSRNRISTSIAKAEISTGSNSSPTVSTSSDTNVNSEDQASAASKKNIKTNPVRNHLSFLDDILKIL